MKKKKITRRIGLIKRPPISSLSSHRYILSTPISAGVSPNSVNRSRRDDGVFVVTSECVFVWKGNTSSAAVLISILNIRKYVECSRCVKARRKDRRTDSWCGDKILITCARTRDFIAEKMPVV